VQGIVQLLSDDPAQRASEQDHLFAAVVTGIRLRRRKRRWADVGSRMGGWRAQTRVCRRRGNCDNGQETAVKNFDRITVDPAQMGGVPCVRRLRIPVATVLRLLAGGLTEGEILAEYPDLETADIRECLRFAAAWALERELPLPHSA
jgi:uncharacterized protein (DUF433 family)